MSELGTGTGPWNMAAAAGLIGSTSIGVGKDFGWIGICGWDVTGRRETDCCGLGTIAIGDGAMYGAGAAAMIR